MKSTMLVVLLAAVCPRASGADQDARAAYLAARRARLEAAAVRTTRVNAKADWKGWLAKNFPDASKSWPEECAKSFDGADAAWDFVGKGDIDRDGAPTGLMLRVKPSPNPDRPDLLVVADLIVTKCADGQWKTILSLSGDVSFFVGHGDDANSPGLVISVADVDAKGRVVSEGEDFSYLPKLKRYGNDAEREAIAQGREARKAKPRAATP